MATEGLGGGQLDLAVDAVTQPHSLLQDAIDAYYNDIVGQGCPRPRAYETARNFSWMLLHDTPEKVPSALAYHQLGNGKAFGCDRVQLEGT